MRTFQLGGLPALIQFSTYFYFPIDSNGIVCFIHVIQRSYSKYNFNFKICTFINLYISL